MFHHSKNKPLPLPTIVNLDRDKLTLCDNRSSTTLVFSYPTGAVKDLEIANHDELAKQLQVFINQHQLSPTHLVFVLSPNLYYEKELSHLSQEERHDQARKFTDMIPFGSVGSKIFHSGNEYKAVAINRDFYESIKSAFESQGFTITAVVPSFVVSSLGIKEDFNIDACRLILKKMDFMLENSFLARDISDQTLVEKQRHFLKEHSTIFAITSLVFVLIAVFTATITLRRPLPSRIVTASPPIPNKVVITPSVPPTPAPATSAAFLTTSVLNGSGLPGLATKIETELRTLGLVNIKTGNATSSANNTLVIYSPRVPIDLRNQIAIALKKFFISFSSQENPATQYDILITTGTSTK